MNTKVTMTLDDVKRLPLLTADEAKIIKSAKPTPNKDCLVQTKEELKKFKPWYEVLSKSQKWAKENKMTEEDIAAAIKVVRKHS